MLKLPVRLLSALLLLVVLALGAGSGAVHAQQSQPAQQQDGAADESAANEQDTVVSLQALMDEAEQAQQEIGSGLISDSRLAHWRQRLPEIRSRAAAIEQVARQDLESAQRLLDALGPAPEDGREPRPVATERDRLQSRVSEHEARMRRAQLLVALSNELINEVQGTARQRFTDQLLVQGPSPVYPQTWADAATQFRDTWARLFAGIASAGTPQLDSAGYLRIAGGGAALTLGGLIVALLIRRELSHRFQFETGGEVPSTLRRLTGALLHTLFYLLVPGLVLGALYAYLEATGLMVGIIDQLTRNAMLAISFGFLIDGLSRSVLATDAPAWRVLSVTDASARRLERLGTITAMIFGADILLVRMGQVLQAGEAIAVVHHLLFGTIISAVVIWLVQREIWQTPDTTEDEAARTFRSKTHAWATFGAILFAALVLSSVILGYYQLSRFVLTRVILSGILIGLLMLLRAVAHESIAAIFRATRLRARGGGDDQTSSILQFWIGAGLDLLLFALGALLALPLWGVDWTDLWALLRGAMLGFQIGDITISPVEIAIAIALFVAILSVTRLVQRALDTRVFPQTKLDIGVRDSLRTFTGYLGLVLAGLLALSTAGLNLSNLAIVAGALSVGIGFGLQAIVNNFVSGLILLFERPMKVGDWVVIGAHQGYVKRIRVRSTEIETFDQSSVIVPNSDFISQAIVNWTHGNRVCRIIVPVHVAYGSDTQQVHDILLEVAREHAQVLRMPEPHVLFMSFGESAMHFELRVYSRDVDYFLSLGSELRFAIDQRFREAGIVIPFPQRDLHIRSGTWQQGETRQQPPTDIPDQGTTPPSGGPDGE